jgi:hypothetical protein
MTPIEQALFLDGSAHCIASFALSGNAIMLTLHPWERPNDLCHARFSNPRIVSVDDSYADEGRELPWDIIGFD